MCCCELLQNVYLCISMYNKHFAVPAFRVVVNCFKMCIFALACTTLQEYEDKEELVVNCFKMCIFALACTTCTHEFPLPIVL